MSRSGYSDDCEQWALIRWRGAVAAAIRGKRGQEFMREMLAALEALPEKRLISNDLIRDGDVCAIGSVGLARGKDMNEIDPEDNREIAEEFGISHALACEIMYQNDEEYYSYQNQDIAEARYTHMYNWIKSNLVEAESK